MATRPAPAAPRFHCEATLAVGATVRLSERAARHVAALRMRVGDALTLFNGDGYECAAVLTGIGKRGVTAAVRERRAVDRESPLDVRLVQGVCAGDRMDLVLQKATELGVAAIHPLVTTRSVVRLSSDRRERRETHWQNVVIAACEQCGRNRIPQVAPSLGFGEYFAALPARAGETGVRILLAPDGAASLRSLAPHTPVTVLVGPEGGLAPEEREIAVAAGFVTVRFGPRILRTETAPLAMLAALQAIYGDC
jgi:16S rRNA (uracil1498-N3)-methyltransferase